jgi:hypothetical protein
MNVSNTDDKYPPQNTSVQSAKLFNYFYGKCDIMEVMAQYGVIDKFDKRYGGMSQMIEKAKKKFLSGKEIDRTEVVKSLRCIMQSV